VNFFSGCTLDHMQAQEQMSRWSRVRSLLPDGVPGGVNLSTQGYRSGREILYAINDSFL
jgi:hypothetical protein